MDAIIPQYTCDGLWGLLVGTSAISYDRTHTIDRKRDETASSESLVDRLRYCMPPMVSHGQMLVTAKMMDGILPLETKAESPVPVGRGAVVTAVAKLYNIPADWNGPRSKPIHKDCLHNATFFAQSLERNIIANCLQIPLPHVGPTVSGGVVFEWFGDDTFGKELVYTFSFDQEFKITFVRTGGDSEIDEEGLITHPEQISSHLHWLSGDIDAKGIAV